MEAAAVLLKWSQTAVVLLEGHMQGVLVSMIGLDDFSSLLGYRMNIQSDWNINAAEFKNFLSLNPPKITCVS